MNIPSNQLQNCTYQDLKIARIKFLTNTAILPSMYLSLDAILMCFQFYEESTEQISQYSTVCDPISCTQAVQKRSPVQQLKQ